LITKQISSFPFQSFLVISGLASTLMSQYFLGCAIISSSILFQTKFSMLDEWEKSRILGPIGTICWIGILQLHSAMGPEQIMQGGSLVTLSLYSISSLDSFGSPPKIAFHSSWAISASSAVLFSFLENWEASTVFLLFIYLYTFPNFNKEIKWDLPITFLSLGLGIRFAAVLLSTSKGGGLGNEIDVAHELWIMFLSAPIFGVSVYLAIIEKINSKSG